MTEQTEFEKGRNGAMTFGAIVYTGVVLAATTLFISFIMTAFPKDAYFSRFIMGTAGLMIGASMLAFPIAMHTWAISNEGKLSHRLIATLLYYGEMAIIALNTIVSFAALLYEYANTPLPAWVAWYEPFSIVSIIYTLFAWGTLFLTDPAAKAKDKEMQAEQKFRARIADKKLEYLDSVEGEQAVLEAANAEIASSFKPKTASRQHFGAARAIPADTNMPIIAADKKLYQQTTLPHPIDAVCQECGLDVAKQGHHHRCSQWKGFQPATKDGDSFRRGQSE